MTIWFGLLATLLALGMVSAKEEKNQRNCTVGFCVCVVAIVVLAVV